MIIMVITLLRVISMIILGYYAVTHYYASTGRAHAQSKQISMKQLFGPPLIIQMVGSGTSRIH